MALSSLLERAERLLPHWIISPSAHDENICVFTYSIIAFSGGTRELGHELCHAISYEKPGLAMGITNDPAAEILAETVGNSLAGDSLTDALAKAEAWWDEYKGDYLDHFSDLEPSFAREEILAAAEKIIRYVNR